MFADGNSFIYRARIFHSALKANSYPTAPYLAKTCRCSPSTARRVIARLRDEYGFPVTWDHTRQGYKLTDPDFAFETLPPGKDELTALVLMRILASPLQDEGLNRNLDSLAALYKSASPALLHDLAIVPRYLSSDSTAVSTLADVGVLELLNAACIGADVEIEYQSPWRHEEPKRYRGRIEKLHYSDDLLYLLFFEAGENGRRIVLNAASILGMRVLEAEEALRFDEGGGAGEEVDAESWPSGFGIWSGGEVEEVEIRIAMPAARYFARQVWHESQVDEWEGEGNAARVLVRRMRAVVSPELVRRVLSLGGAVVGVKPEGLREAVEAEVRRMLGTIAATQS